MYETYKEFGTSTPIDLDIDKTLRRLNREQRQLVLEEESVMGEENNGENQVPN